MNKKGIKIIIILLILGALVLLYYNFFSKNEKIDEVFIVDSIMDYDYTLYNNKSDLYNGNFKALKNILNSKEVNYEEYAKTISKLFVIDFYSLDDKITNTDIGGVMFIHPNIKDNFILKAEDTIYKSIESNLNGKRKQVLPKVNAVEVVDFNSEGNYYFVTIKIKYIKDLEYPNEVKIVLVHEDKKLFVIEVL